MGHGGAGVVAKNITEHGEFDLMKPGRFTNALIAVVQIEHYDEIVVVLKTEVTAFVN